MTGATSATARAAAERHTGRTTASARPLGGTAFLVDLDGGERVVTKRGAGPGAARAEAAGLRWLAEPGDVPVPEVFGDDEDWLVMRHVPGGPASPAAAERFGRGLAALHLRGAPAFGAPPPGGPTDAWMGLAPMRNEHRADWPTFYARDRVEPYVRMAADQGVFTADQVAVFDRLCARLPELAGPAEPPARLHGDTWSGNVHWADDGLVWLIDPAAHGGHRESDLAMLRVFGLPHLDRVLGAYAEAAADAGAPLADGWPDRVGLHQLHILLVHAALFGGGYGQQSLAAARDALRLG
ncbi:Fructosamine-3-kinase [Amycolatopsis arida]|uniref:Fructosamine-3-kinase n=1 Tax=Amycolatopsis arida TaxID=587909 RepID=A0A1I5WAP9_9PSEU|nr:fructosamine kinase family protein [Amycolatopsis arida]TDX92191.1 fructosamine-3-kinase [Amycolatopsis arida]SFQ16792.1 Fructosamine-3-kinase [Amycolatopsis arida]